MSSMESEAVASAPDGKGRPSKAKKPPKFASVKDLVARVVATRRPIVSRPDFVALKDAPAPTQADYAESLQAALGAPAAQVLRSLMTTAAAAQVVPAVAREVAEFARAVYRAHPQVKDLMREANVFPLQQDLEISRLRNDLQQIKTARDARIGETKDVPDANGKAAQKRIRGLRRDADMLRDAVIALHYAAGHLDEPLLLELVSERTRPSRRADPGARCEALFWLLAKPGEGRGIAAIVTAFEERLSSQRSLASSAQARAEALDREAASRQAIVNELHAGTERLQGELTAHLATIESLNAQIRQMQGAEETVQVHHTDDLSRLRARIIRLLEGEKSHLSDSLAALKSQPPKVDVALSYVTTAHDRIAAEIPALRNAA